MGLEGVDFFECVVVEHSNLHIVRAGNYPVLPWDEFRGTNWQVAHLKAKRKNCNS